MPLKALLDIIPQKLEQREVEIPDSCPHCGTSFANGFNLREKAYTLTLAGLDIINGEKEFRGSSSTWHETEFVVGYECAACEKTIV